VHKIQESKSLKNEIDLFSSISLCVVLKVKRTRNDMSKFIQKFQLIFIGNILKINFVKGNFSFSTILSLNFVSRTQYLELKILDQLNLHKFWIVDY
jgi:hypothetical protein